MIEQDEFGAITADKRYWWLDGSTQPFEARIHDGNGTLVATRRYYKRGEIEYNSSGAVVNKYYYTKDHTGSVRDLLSSTGTVQAKYDYDPYGRRTRTAVSNSTADTVVSYTGHHWHEKSGVYLTWYRQYDPELGRWLSRDPLGEEEGDGPNLYSYVLNNPIILFDPTGLKAKEKEKKEKKENVENKEWRLNLSIGLSGTYMKQLAPDSAGMHGEVSIGMSIDLSYLESSSFFAHAQVAGIAGKGEGGSGGVQVSLGLSDTPICAGHATTKDAPAIHNEVGGGFLGAGSLSLDKGIDSGNIGYSAKLRGGVGGALYGGAGPTLFSKTKYSPSIGYIVGGGKHKCYCPKK